MSIDTVLDKIISTPSIGSKHPNSGSYFAVNESNWGVASYPLGAYYDATDVSFAVYSRHAPRILLEIYTTAAGRELKYDYWMKKSQG